MDISNDDYSGSLPQKSGQLKKGSGVDYGPEWEDLSLEQKAQFGNPMRYARHMMELQIKKDKEENE